MTSVDKTKKRNLSYNLRHRKYGDEATMYDFDAVLFNVGTEQVVGYLETKYGGTTVDLNSKEFRCLGNACLAGKPFFCLWYYTYSNGLRLNSDDNLTKTCDYAQYVIIGCNEEGRKIYPKLTELTETEYVYFEYKLRGYSDEFCRCKSKGFSTALQYHHSLTNLLFPISNFVQNEITL